MEQTELTAAVNGEVDSSRATQVRRAINKLIKQANSSDFDLADLLYEAKTKMYFQGWGFDSFSQFAKSLDIKYTKSYYLVGIKENMVAAGLDRPQYEPVGKTKLRMIAELDPDAEYKDTPVKLLIRELTLKAAELSPDEVRFEVDAILGLTEEESLVWMNTRVKKLAKDNVIIPAYRKAKRFMGQQKDEESGEFKDATDGAALEMICANFLTDPNYDTPEDAAPEATDAGSTTGGIDTTPEAGEVESPAEPQPETTETDNQYAID